VTPNHVQTHGIEGKPQWEVFKKIVRLLVIFQTKSTFSIANNLESILRIKLTYRKMWEIKTTIINRNLPA
jgi:hypothetical protein